MTLIDIQRIGYLIVGLHVITISKFSKLDKLKYEAEWNEFIESKYSQHNYATMTHITDIFCKFGR